MRQPRTRDRPQPQPARDEDPETIRSTAPRRASDEGSATVWTVAMVGLVAAYALTALALGTAALARHRAGAAADFAALAAAAHADPDSGGSAADSPCSWAEPAVHAQGATLVSCHCDGDVCEVRAAAPTPWGTAAVTSRAGPAEARQVEPGQVYRRQPDSGQAEPC